MRCRDIMKTDVECAKAQTSVAEAAALMRDEQIGFLPICDEALNVIGTLTDRDIVIRAVADKKPHELPVREIMTPDVVACLADDDLSAAQELMGEMQVSRILCLSESGQLEGVISLSDIAQVGDGAEAAAILRSVTVREARLPPE